MNAIPPSSPTASANVKFDEACRIIIVDDSTVIRGLIARAFEGQSDLRVVARAADGQKAVDALRRTPADVIILDIEMPVMDGLTAIPLLKAVDPAVQIIMASTLTKKNADISLKALELGAADYIPKPTSTQELAGTGADSFAHDLLEKIRVFGPLARKKGVRLSARPAEVMIVKAAVPAAEKKKIALRPMPVNKPDIIAIGSSTGGPQALFTTIKAIGPHMPQPIVITQHMPPSFTTILAEHIARQCQVTCSEGVDGEMLKPGHYYIAPGDFHMLLTRKAEGVAIRLVKDEPENFCRPAVDPMLRSLVDVYKNKILAVILTGMGQDGLKGGQAVIDAGGYVVAQDEATSVVWGMPGAVATAGLCSAVLPIGEIGSTVRKVAMGAGV